eukprot:GHVU01223414.1.p1 GENE.GHVU01223414.1~~GHVU01223414.1.p1  ORF type:complete len:104 (-),score=1.95 GHVU01223414.1:320-631(-)
MVANRGCQPWFPTTVHPCFRDTWSRILGIAKSFRGEEVWRRIVRAFSLERPRNSGDGKQEAGVLFWLEREPCKFLLKPQSKMTIRSTRPIIVEEKKARKSNVN